MRAPARHDDRAGESYEQGIDRLVHADSPTAGHDHMQMTIGSPRDIDDADAATHVENFLTARATTRLAVHGGGPQGRLVRARVLAGRDARQPPPRRPLLAADDGARHGHPHPLGHPTADEIADRP
jgi:hypothetical protein